MKNLFLVIVLLFPLYAMAQYPQNPNKQRLGYQTSALGLTYYSDTIPLHEPSNYLWDTQVVIDTTNDVSYQWTGYSWRATGVVRQVLAPPATKTAGGNTLDYRYADWWRDIDSVAFTFNWDNTCWMPLQPYRGDTIPDNEAAVGSSIGATCYTNQLWYDTDADSLKAYTAGEWIAVGSGGGGGSGVVESIVAGSGIHVDNTDPANPEITNIAQDQPIILNDAGTVDVTGTYPTFTITGTGITATTLTDSMTVVRDSIAAVRAAIGSGGGGTVDAIVAGTGISVDATDAANPIVTNSAPDQTVSIVGAGTVGVTGTYPSFTVTGTGDDLGNHIATQNIILDDFWLSNDGGNEGVTVTNDGRVGVGASSSNVQLNIAGSALTQLAVTNSSTSNSAYSIDFRRTSTASQSSFNWSTGGSPKWNMGQDNDGTEDIKFFDWTSTQFFQKWHSGTANVSFGYTVSSGAGTTLYIDNANSRIGVGTSTPAYKLSIGGTDASILLAPHNTTLTGTEGLLFANSVTKGLKGHDGTSFYRVPKFTDANATNGQVPVFNSTTGMYAPTTLSSGTMSSWTLAADTGTPATITDGTTATIAGSTEGIDVAISGNTATVSLDYSEVAVTTTLGGNEYFQIYDVTDGNRQVHIDSLTSYLAGNLGIYSGSGTIPDNTTAQTAAGAGFVVDGEGYIQFTGSEILENADIWATNASTISFTDRAGEGTEMLTLTDGVMGYASDTRALINTQTSGRAVMFDGSNYVSEFPLESTLGLTRQTQSTAFEVARGTTGERPAATTAGRIRWNTTTTKLEISNGSGWDNPATEDYVDDAITETNFTQNADLAIFPDKKIEHVTLESTSGAASNTTLSLPTASSVYDGYMVKVWSIDTSGSFDNDVTASTIQNGATTTGTITLGNFQATEISCIRVGSSTYRWVVTNQY